MYLLYWCQPFLLMREMNYVTCFYLMSKKVEVHFSSQFMDFHRVLNLIFSVLKLLNLAAVPMVVSKGWDRGGWCTFSHVSGWIPTSGWKEHCAEPAGHNPVSGRVMLAPTLLCQGLCLRESGLRLGHLQTWVQVLTWLIPESIITWWYFDC